MFIYRVAPAFFSPSFMKLAYMVKSALQLLSQANARMTPVLLSSVISHIWFALYSSLETSWTGSSRDENEEQSWLHGSSAVIFHGKMKTRAVALTFGERCAIQYMCIFTFPEFYLWLCGFNHVCTNGQRL